MRSHFKHAFLYLACQFSYVFAAPAGGVVAQGGANIIGQGTNQVTINQSTNKAIINWQTFDVGNNQSVTFNTPGANAATLNRISGNATQILGNVTSNGQLWLINPNGIMFGKNAQINVAGLVASTLDINDHDFMTGNYRLEQQGASFAKIVNQGHINAEGGYVAMLAPQIENTGIIQAKLGTVAMGAGTKATLQFQSNQMLNFVIDEGASVPMFDENGQSVAALSHAGQIEANGGQVLLTAQSINSMLDQSINVSGIIQADTVEDRPGKIVLLAKANAVVNDGRLSAQGLNSGEQGGKVAVIGRNVGLFGTSNINASGAAGGGEIRVGRDDTDPNAFEANATVVARGVQLKAEATQTGNGGLIETSGHYLNVSGAQVSTKAATGQSGTWLLDPYNVTISNAATSTEDFSGGAYTPTADDSIINIDDLLANLENGSVSVLTAGSGTQSGDITVAEALTYAGTNALTLTAAGSVYLNAAINLGGDFNVSAGASISQTSSLIVDGTTTLSAFGNIVLENANNDFNTAIVSGAHVNLADADAIILGESNATGNFTLTANGAVTQSGALDVVGTTSVSVGVSNNITLNNAGNNFGNQAVTLNGAGVTIKDANPMGLILGDINSAGDVSVTANHAIRVDGTINAGSQAINLTSGIEGLFNGSISGSGVIQTTGATTLSALDEGDHGNSIFLSGNNQLAALGIVHASYVNINNNRAAGLTINNIASVVNGVTVKNINGAITVAGTINTTGLILEANGALTDGGSGLLQNSGDTDLKGTYIDFTGDNVLSGGLAMTATATEANSGQNIRLNALGNVGLSAVSSTAPGGAVDITARGGVVTLSGQVSSGGNLALTATKVDGNGGLIQVSGGSVNAVSTNLSAATGINFSTGENDFGDLTASTTNGAISINSAGVLSLGNITAMDDFAQLSLTAGGDVTQLSGTALNIAGTSSLDAGTNSITLGNAANQFGGAVLASGNDIVLATSGTLNLAQESAIYASGDVTLAAGQLNNTGGATAVTVGEGNVWNIYLTHLDDNTFGDLVSGNQAIWGTDYSTSISQAGNRYIFGTNQTLNLTAVPDSMNFSANYGEGTPLPAPISGVNYNASGFVDASAYGDVFTQDTVDNVFSSLDFYLNGAANPADPGVYDIYLQAKSSNGYTLKMENNDASDPYGLYTVIFNRGESIALGGAATNPNVTNPALVARNIQNALPQLDKKGALQQPLTEQELNNVKGINPKLNTGELSQ